MYRLIIIPLLICTFASGQSKKPIPKNTKPVVQADTLPADTVYEEEEVYPDQFTVYTKKPSKTKPERMKLCLNLVGEETILNYCLNDSLLHDPEVSKIIFEQKQGDSTYVLIHVQAFSKPKDKVECDAGKEQKLFFVRWNQKTNKAIVKQKTFESCMRGITNMTREPIDSWDKSSLLILKYNRADVFGEIKFDPQQYLTGLQSSVEK
jgi:hypothetical protein